MGLFRKIFRGAGLSPVSLQFQESEAATDQVKARNGPRRELVKVVLRDTMRKHGIPSDWIDCRILSVMTRQHKFGVHVQLLVRKGDEQLLNYVHAFQESFRQEIDKFDPHAQQWLFSVAWQFEGKAMPDPTAWCDAGATSPPKDGEGDVTSDLQALQALMSRSAELAELQAGKPRRHSGPGAPIDLHPGL